MSEISDMLRDSADDMERNPGVDQHLGPEFLRGLACRIDKTMVEWPLGADKKRIKPGQTVYLSPLGNTGDGFVRGISFDTDGPTVCVEREGALMAMMPEWLTHERPDSWSRIAQELEDMSENFRMTDKESFSALLDFADRIRRLAGREASNGTD